MNLILKDRKKIYDGIVFNVYRDECEYNSGNKTIREVIQHNGGSVIVPICQNGDLILIKQFRYPLQKEMIELPAGKLFKNEIPIECAKRELEEETGFISENISHLTTIQTTPGFCDEELHIFLAQNVSSSKNGRQLEEGEEGMQIFQTSFKEATKMIMENKITDGKTICGILIAKEFLKL